MIRLWAILMSALAAIAADGPAPGVPRPAPTPRTWQLDFEFHDPARVTLTLPGHTEPATFWYLLYTVTNDTGREARFYPMFHLVTDTLQVVEGGDRIHPKVYDAIRARHRRQCPFFVPPPAAYGVLHQGSDNRRTSAAVFRSFDPQASGFAVYVAGLSGEIVRLNNPTYDAGQARSDNNQRFFILRKTLAIHYDLPGDNQTRRTAVPTRVKREWVMR